MKFLKKYFIPHLENNYHPHFLHTKRTIFYFGFFLTLKIMLIGMAAAIPASVFVLPDVLSLQQEKIISLTNDLRTSQGIPLLIEQEKLNNSSHLKVKDMAEQQYFSHISPDNYGLDYFLRQADYAYQSAGENLAMGFIDPDQLIKAWRESPTHYQNLLDADYQEIGVGLSAGFYNNSPTIYTAQHFGAPKDAAALAVQAAGNLRYDEQHSHLNWVENNGRIQITAQAVLAGPVAKADVHIKDWILPLMLKDNKAGEFKTYASQIELPMTAKELFKVVLAPSLVVADRQGEKLLLTIPWHNPYLTPSGPVEKYVLSAKYVSFFKPAFSFLQGVYLGFLLIFVISLTIMILVEIRKQHPHIILQTLALIGLLIVLLIC